MINTISNTAGTDERRRRYREMLDFYRGRQRTGREEARLTLNYAAAVVDKLTAYLMNGLSVRVAAADDSAGARARARRAQALIDRACDQLLDYETEIDAAVLGDGCYRLGWDAAAKTVRVSAPDMAGINVEYTIDGVKAERLTLAYTVDAASAASAWGFTAAGKEVEVVETWTVEAFEVVCGGVVAAGGENPYGCIPFLVFPNLPQPKSVWGASDLDNLIEVQRELNRAAGQLSHILELSGNPIAVLENVESSKDIAVSPGAVWHLPEEARAYLLDLLQGGGAQLHISYIDLLFRVLHDLGEMPRAAFGGVGRDISGVALELELQPLLHRVWRKRLIRTGVYKKRAEMMLVMYARFLDEDFSGCAIEVNWAPVLPRDTAALVVAEKSLIESGIHCRKTAMRSFGVDNPEYEFGDWLAEQQAITGQNPVAKNINNNKEE